MGYDDFECIVCYCRYRINHIPDDDNRCDVCLNCISCITKGNDVSERVIGVLQSNLWTCNSSCDSCKNDGIVTIEVAACRHHLGDFLSSEENESEEIEC